MVLLPGNSEKVLACWEPLIPTCPLVSSPVLLSEMQQPSGSMRFKPRTFSARSTACLQMLTGRPVWLYWGLAPCFTSKRVLSMLRPKGFEKLVQNCVCVLLPTPQAVHPFQIQREAQRSLRAVTVRLLLQSWQCLDNFQGLFTAGRALSALCEKHCFLFLPIQATCYKMRPWVRGWVRRGKPHSYRDPDFHRQR